MVSKRRKINWRRLLSSIQFKVALVFTLTLLVTLEVIGAFFVKQLERQSINQLRTQLTLKPYVTDSLTEQLSNGDQTNADSKIHTILNSINNPTINEVMVIDAQGVIRGTSQVDRQDLVGRKDTDQNIRAALSASKYNRHPIEERDGVRYQLVIRPLINTVNGESRVVGVVAVRASLETIYRNLDNISLIFLSASVLAVALGIMMAIIIARSLSNPLREINRRTIRIAQGDYGGDLEIRSNDEIGQLAENVNDLANQIERTTNSIDFERRRLDSVLEYMTDGVLATDRRGNIEVINTTAAKLLNIEDANQAIGKSILSILKIETAYNLRDLVVGRSELDLDFSNDQQARHLQAYFSLIQRASGFVSGMVIVLHDVTEQYQLDVERRQFVSNVSHELRTPLTSVKSYVDALQEGAIDDPALAHSFLTVLQDETSRMIHMINDLLELSRMDSGTSRVENETVNIAELFNYVLNRFDMIIANDDGQSQGKHYTIRREIPDVEIWVELDPSRFIQVIDNIMNNAIKYSPDGGVISAKLNDQQDEVVLSISDQGLGIPAKDVQHVFDRFFRVDKARSRKQGGTGLGLAISKEIIEQFGGRIWLESTEGQGTTFFIALPYEPLDLDEDEWDE
ncbi:cell wall metabolism sensor histidine kinase WalK [Weissella halotolerans]|uniref:histidine kinase n=1 Tax=Weissella halotolerans DSM 20190 TaxID=1123500 RepID=A0A0R2G1D8_9LACO|nr:cell wall metabolism sensor histidine kinase WalK [Weissella halotolerans]KRN31228.1 histidine protein kinase [Weissella halotolerans DSM 20190]